MIKEQKEIKDRASLLKQRYLYGTVQSLVNENSSQLNTGTRRGIGRSGVVDKCSVRTDYVLRQPSVNISSVHLQEASVSMLS